MTRLQIRQAAKAIFQMRVNRVERQSQTELNQRRIAIKKRLEDKRYQMALNRVDEWVAG